MVAALIILLSLVVVGLPLYLLHRRDVARSSDDNAPSPSPVQDAENGEGEECCGMHITCEKDSLLASVSPEIEYYDDEELDVFAGRRPDDYNDSEIEQFRDVLLTLLPDDIAGWARSIQLRGINLPETIREELLLIVSEARKQR